MAKDDWPALQARLEGVRSKLLAQEGLIINLTADPDALESTQPVVDAFVGKLPAVAATPSSASTWRDAVQLLPRDNEAYAITTQVNYVAAGTKLFEEGEQIDGAYYAVARYLSRGYLWDNVRVVGGAYGGGCAFNVNTGAFAFSSYRDPNVQGTLDIYAKSAEVLANVELTDEALEQAIVGAVGDLDSPMNAQQKGFRALTHHLTGVTPETRQKFRDEVRRALRTWNGAHGSGRWVLAMGGCALRTGHGARDHVTADCSARSWQPITIEPATSCASPPTSGHLPLDHPPLTTSEHSTSWPPPSGRSPCTRVPLAMRTGHRHKP